MKKLHFLTLNADIQHLRIIAFDTKLFFNLLCIETYVGGTERRKMLIVKVTLLVVV